MLDVAQRLASLSPAQRQLLESRLKKRPQVAQPIAIVGMSCRLSGAANLEDYWRLICDRRNAFREIPGERWDIEEYFDPDPDAVGKMSVRTGAFIDHIYDFDAMFFGISPREASRMDPQQRLLLEVCWEALEHGGLAPERIAGTSTGVFVGIGGTDYSKIPAQFDNYYDFIDAHIGTGNALSIAANRISYILDLRGPSVAVDTACSSGMVGLHMAIQALRSGECDAALAGAVNLILSPETTMAFSKARMLSPTGQCRPFDAEANGYVRGEGCAMVVVKRLTDATRDGDPVLAVIRGSAINQDGRTSGITAPNALSQQACIRAALASAGLDAEELSYLEAHGTGTPLGDPIEFQSLRQLFPRRGDDEPSCYVGSVKANIGHTETVSGIAGLIKVLLMLKHGIIPPQAGLKELNPNIQLDGTRLRISRETVPWPGNRPRVAGISSFGFGGTNTHVVIESAAATPAVEPPQSVHTRPKHILTVSAKSQKALRELAGTYRERLDELPDERIADFCHSANCGRSHFNSRAAIVTDAKSKLLQQLQAIADGKRASGAKIGDVRIAMKPKLAFLFTGQGAQYVGMGKTLYETHPVFRQVMEDCDDILRHERDKRLLEVIYADRTDPTLNETGYTQPALFALEYALAKLWQSWGVEPSIMLGHSVGEYVAACLAGVFSLEDGLRLIAKRAELMQRLPQIGTMAVLFARREQVAEAIQEYGEQVSVATANGPENNVISGKSEIVEEVVAGFEKAGVGTQRLTVSHAFHSPLMDPILDEFEAFAATLHYDRPTIPIVANRFGRVIESGEFDAAYWRDHLRNCVEFDNGMRCIEEYGVHAMLEVGPTASLLGMGRRCLPEAEVAWVPSLRKGRDDWETLFTAVAELYVLGVKVDWSSFDSPWPRRRVELPTYPFQRTEHFLLNERAPVLISGGQGPTTHPLLGRRVPTALDAQLYDVRLSIESPRYLRDHVVQGSPILPAAAYIEQGLAVARQVFGDGNHGLEDVSLHQGLFLPAESSRLVQVSVGREMAGRATMDVYSIDAENTDPKARWDHNASASIVHVDALEEPPSHLPVDLEEFRAGIIRAETRDEVYELFGKRGLSYGPAFRGLRGISRRHLDAVGDIELPPSAVGEMDKYLMHPVLGDALLQMIAAAVPLEQNNEYSPYAYVPVRIRRFRIRRAIQGRQFLGYAVRTSKGNETSPETLEADIYLCDPSGDVLAVLEGVTIHRVGRAIDGSETQDPSTWLFRIDWQPQPISSEASALRGGYLVFADDHGYGQQLAAAIHHAGATCGVVTPGDQFTVRDGDQPGYTLRPTASEDYQALISHFAAQHDVPLHGIVHFWNFDVSDQDASHDNWEHARDLGCVSPLRLVQQLARAQQKPPPQLWLMTQAAQDPDGAGDVHPLQAPVWGLGRVAALEHPEFHCRLVDFAADAPADFVAERTLAELRAAPDEDQILHRGDDRLVARLAPAPGLTTPARSGDGMIVPSREPFRLQFEHAGSFDALKYQTCQRHPPQDGQVEIEVKATGLNFSDVLKALGLYPGITDEIVPMGIECAGVVTAVGPHVDRFQVGDKVMGVAPYSFASHATTAEYAIVKIPAGLEFDEAATIPITYLTAYYGLKRLAHLQPGERVLIHAGAGGVGLAAIQIAQQIGAEIFATAGSDEKREFLRSLGVPHVMNSRTLDFADEILSITHREGVDVVLNSLPGDAIAKSLSVLRAYGRFLEIGKTDIYSNTMIGLLPFQDNLSYFAIDLDRMLRQRPDYVREMFAELIDEVAKGKYAALPFTRFRVDETIEAFRYMAQRKNIGKVVVAMQDRSENTQEETSPEFSARADGTYLITGGLGALGLGVANWLGTRGAKQLALLSRRVPNEAGQAAIAALEQRGLRVVALQGDVSDFNSLQSALAQIPSDFPPVRGVVHAAGVLADGVIYDMELTQFDQPLKAKIAGTWNLHRVTSDAPLDFFVMFSSVASVLGSPGQCNYAAANAYLDAIAAYRQADGKPAISINWGPWAEAGMAAETHLQQQLAQRGMGMLPSHQALNLMGDLIRANHRQTVVLSVNWTDLLRAGGGHVPTLLRDVADGIDLARGGGESSEDRAFRMSLLQVPHPERREKLTTYFTAQLAFIMGLDPEDINPEQPLNTMGLDSLMAIELKNKIESRLQTTLPMAAFMHEPTVSSLAQHVAESYGQEAETGEPAAAAEATQGGAIPS